MTYLSSIHAPRLFARLRQETRWALLLAATLSGATGCSDSSGGTGTNPDYSLSVAPASLTVMPGGGTTSTTVTIDRTDFTGEVTLSLSGVPAGVSGIFDPVTTTGTTSTLALAAAASSTSGDYNVIVRGTSSAGDRARPVSVTVGQQLPSFSLSVDPTDLRIGRGTSNGTGVIVTRVDFTGPVTLGLVGAPAGVTWLFSPAAPTGTGSTLTIFVGAAATPGISDMAVTGIGTVGSSSAALTLTVF